MSDQYCFVCASNEGVFLDVTPDNLSTFGDQVETCLSTKINKCIDLSNKICYKCAYELDQCTKFVKKYKKSHKVSELKVKTSMSCCFLCYELVGSDRIFDITKDNNVIFNPLRKIRSIFDDDVSKNDSLKLICLTCRYNLDVLYDLKRIYQEATINLKALINDEISYSNFPKVHTDVVNRKTTITTFPDITFYGSVNSSDSEEDMARGKQRVKARKTRSNRNRNRSRNRNRNAQIKSRSNQSKIRNCDKCHNAVASSINMYRFYRTGLTVCKNCLITIDPSSDKTRRSRQVRSNLVETKLCTVFLTDVLNQESYGKKKIHEVEKDKDDNTLYDSSQEEAKSSENSTLSVSLKTRNHIVNGKARRATKRCFDMEKSKDDVERTPSKMTRLSKERINTNEIKSAKALVDAEQQPSTQLTKRQERKKIVDDTSSDSVDAEQQSSHQLTKRQERGCKRKTDDRSSDSEGSLEQKEIRRNKLNDRVNKTNRKKQKSNLEETTSNARLNSSDETSNEDGSLRHKAKNAVSSPTVSVKKEEERSTRSRTRSSSISSTEMTSPMEFKSPKSLAQSEAKTEYVCDKCNKKFSTKLSNAKHRLTHLKQAALKLEKLTVSSVKKKQEMEADSQDDEISKEATSQSNRTISTDKHTDDPSEDIPINIEDDTDDEEIFNLLTKENVKKKVEKEVNDDDGTASNVIDKPDTAKSESHIKEESSNDGNIETKESEQYEKSDDTVTLEMEDDKDIRDKYVTEDKDKTSANKDSEKSKDKDTQDSVDSAIIEDHVGEEEDKEVEHDTKVSTEKEKIISECNSDKEDLDEETTHDSKTIRSPILSIHNTTKDNENHSENCNNIENCEDDKDETIEESTEIQCDLMDESLKKDTNEPEEKVRKILPTDKTETLSDKGDLDDTMDVNEDKVEEFEKWQNWCNEENMEVGIIVDVDKPNAKDTIRSDLSNGEKHNEIKDGGKDGDVAVRVNDNSNDDEAKCKKIMEETVPADDLTEERKLEEEINDLQELVDDDTMNNKHRKVQENSIYVMDNSSTDAANEILKEVFELAAAEVQQREETNSNIKTLEMDVEMETLENISREIRKSADMPSLDPISVMDIDDDNDITLN